MEIPDTKLAEAWELRCVGIYTMRDIANKLEVNREDLIDQLSKWLTRRDTK